MVATSQRWTERTPLIFGRPDGRVVAATSLCAIRGLRPGVSFFASGDGIEDAAEGGYLTIDEVETTEELLPQAPPPDPPAAEDPPPKPKRAPAKKAAKATKSTAKATRFKRTPAPPPS